MNGKNLCINVLPLKKPNEIQKEWFTIKWSKTWSHILRSSLGSRFKLIKWFGWQTRTVTLIICLRNVLPGKTTVKFNSPMRDCSYFRETFLRFKNSWAMNLYFSNLSCRRRASSAQVSRSIPAKDETVVEHLKNWLNSSTILTTLDVIPTNNPSGTSMLTTKR